MALLDFFLSRKKNTANIAVSASLRVEEFKELRKKNAKVWHGHLAGMPLADVLEADLMEVSLCMEDAGVTEADGQNSELVAA